jgi:hypothetical protein
VYKCLYCILTCFLLDIYTVVSMDHMTVLFLTFYEISILFSIVVVLIYIPTNSISVFLFPTSSPTFVTFAHEDGHSNWGEMKSYCTFDLHLFYGQRSSTLLHIFTVH